MNRKHKKLAEGGWSQLSFVEQMANIGSEIERALNWKVKQNNQYCQQALERALELIELTIQQLTTFSRLKEVARLKEAILDYFYGNNQFKFTDEALRKYFFSFIYAARRNK